MTLIVHFHQSHYRDFKGYYLGYVRAYFKGAFPDRVSYQRVVALIPLSARFLTLMCLPLRAVKARPAGVAFIDATATNVDDRHPVPQLTEALSGKLFGDKDYISKHLFQDPFERGLQLITPIRKNMPNRLLPLFDKCLLRKCSLQLRQSMISSKTSLKLNTAAIAVPLTSWSTLSALQALA